MRDSEIPPSAEHAFWLSFRYAPDIDFDLVRASISSVCIALKVRFSLAGLIWLQGHWGTARQSGHE